VALPLPDERLIPTPPVAAGPLKVTVPIDVVPPITEVGEMVSVAKVGAVIESIAVCVVVPNTAEMVADFVL
jgi:hypothetical protein